MNRLARERLVTVALLSCLSSLAGVATWWAMQPARSIDVEIAPHTQESTTTAIARTPMDASVFELVLWPESAPVVEDPSATAASIASARTPPPPPPASINLSLVAIVEDEYGWRVALYDPGEQRLVLAAEGERVGQVVVREVTAETVLLELAGRTGRLALREDTR